MHVYTCVTRESFSRGFSSPLNWLDQSLTRATSRRSSACSETVILESDFATRCCRVSALSTRKNFAVDASDRYRDRWTHGDRLTLSVPICFTPVISGSYEALSLPEVRETGRRIVSVNRLDIVRSPLPLIPRHRSAKRFVKGPQKI